MIHHPYPEERMTMSDLIDPETGVQLIGWTPEQQRVLSEHSGRGLLGVAPNEFGTPTSVYRCTTCGLPFNVCPPKTVEAYGTDCMDDECPSYDPDRDVQMLLLRGAEVRGDDGSEVVL